MPRSRLIQTIALLCAAPLCAVAPTGTASASGGGGGGDGVHLLAMPMLDVPIVEGDRATGRLRMKLTLRAGDAAALAAIEAEMPALREVALAAAGEFARLRASPYVAVDAGRLSHEMSAAIGARNHAVSGVLLVEISAVRI